MPERSPFSPSLTRQLTRRVLGLSLIGVLGLSSTVFLSAVVTVQQVHRRLQQASLTTVRTLDPIFLNLTSDLLATAGALSTSQDLDHNLRQLRSRHRNLLEVQWLDLQGNLLASTGRSSSRLVPLTLDPEAKSILTQKQKTIHISPLRFQGVPPFVDVATLTRNALGIQSGFVLVRVDLTELWRQTLEQQVGKEGYVYILDESGQILATQRLQWLGQRVTPPTLGPNTQIDLRRNLDGVPVLAVQEKLQLVPWYAVVEQPLLAILTPVLIWGGVAGALLLLGIVVMGTIVHFIQNRIVQPLRSLSEGVTRLEQGELRLLEAMPGAYPTDELGHLGLAFNRMVCQLQQAFTTLEKRVEDRTAELAKTNQSLANEVVQHQQTAASLLKSEAQFRQTFDLAPIGIALISLQGEFFLINRSLSQLLGRSSTTLQDLSWKTILAPKDVQTVVDLARSLLSEKESTLQPDGLQNNLDICYQTTQGDWRYGVLSLTLIRDPSQDDQPSHFIAQIIDVTEHKRVQDQLRYDALHDALTGLANRRLFIELVDHSLKRLHRHANYCFAILFLDLDRFKTINDSLGHQTGDQLLKTVAQRLQGCVRDEDTVARLGGDEFTILLEQTLDDTQIMVVVQRILNAFQLPFHLERESITVGTSIGIVAATPYYQNALELLRDADIAMYRAKQHPTASYAIFYSGMHDEAVKRLKLEKEIRQGLHHREFLLHYQPIIHLETGFITGLEALVRWQRPDGSFVFPGEFIPLAEETGLIVDIGQQVLEEACQQLHHWQKCYAPFQYSPNASRLCPIEVSVNVTGKQLQEPEFFNHLDQLLETFQIDYGLKFELTESMLMGNHLADNLHQLRRRNIKLSIDDFGTGYSSLRYLHNFPVNSLKIDQVFVNQMHGNRSDQNHSSGSESRSSLEIVRAVISLAHTFEMDLVAEGIETPEQADHLYRLGCEFGQGFYFAKPLSSEGVERLLESDRCFLNHRQQQSA
ncbi:MAG: bifunctional diguanylate cyclase/phosphodiesterase [Prochlorotrichaceae cyanobacterium]